jgi:hypothetical protein
MSAPTFTRQGPGHYVADLDDDSGVLRWLILSTGSRRWEIVSVTSGWERRRHGHALTLREAKEAVAVFHRSNLALAAHAAREAAQ